MCDTAPSLSLSPIPNACECVCVSHVCPFDASQNVSRAMTAVKEGKYAMIRHLIRKLCDSSESPFESVDWCSKDSDGNTLTHWVTKDETMFDLFQNSPIAKQWNAHKHINSQNVISFVFRNIAIGF